jgi:hypothetical protein
LWSDWRPPSPKGASFLGRVAGISVSDSTVSRMLKRMGSSRKTIGGRKRERPVAEGSLESNGCWKDGSKPLCVRGRVLTNTSLRQLYTWFPRGERARCRAPRPWETNVILLWRA